MAGGADDLTPLRREILVGLIRGLTPGDLAWAVGVSAEQVVALARDAMMQLNPELVAAVSDEDRERLLDYLLALQSPGQQAGTWRLMERSREARNLALYMREALVAEYAADPPPIPGLDSERRLATRQRKHTDPAVRRGRLRDRFREMRRVRRTRSEIRAAHADQGMFRRRALEALRDRQHLPKLVRYGSPWRTRLLWAALAAVAASLIAVGLSRVSMQQEAIAVIAADTEEASSAPPVLLTLLPADGIGHPRRGHLVRLELPGRGDRVTLPLLRVEGPLAPRDVVSRYGLSDLGLRLPGPVLVGVSALPRGVRGSAQELVGAVARAKVDVGSRRLASLLPVLALTPPRPSR